MKKIAILFFVLLLGSFCVSQAQVVSSADSTTVNESDLGSTPSKEKEKTNKTKWPKKTTSNKDSVSVLQARVMELENIIQQLRSDNDYLKNKPNSSQNKGSAKIIDSLKQEVQRLNNVTDSLNQEVQWLNNALTKQIVTTFGKHLAETDTNNFFCYSVLEYPLYYKYDPARVQRSLDMAKTMGYNKGGKYNWIYNIFYVLLENYSIYNQELIEYVDRVIRHFETGSIDRSFESEKFENWLRYSSEYYKVRGTGKFGGDRHIFFLDFQIERLRELFKSDKNFNKENLKKIRQNL